MLTRISTPLTGLSLQSLKSLSPLYVAFGVHTVLESLIAEEKSDGGSWSNRSHLFILQISPCLHQWYPRRLLFWGSLRKRHVNE